MASSPYKRRLLTNWETVLDRLDAMKLFIRVAEAGSFSKAATDMNIGQPTVSRRIQDLEQRLGAELFLRTTRSLSLTEAGQRFYVRAQEILTEFEDAEAEARGLDQEPVGLLRITAPQSLGRLVIAPTLTAFLKLYPLIKVDMLLDDMITDLVGEGVDLAFRFGRLADSSLMAKRMGEAGRGVWASPEYLQDRGTPRTPADLVEHELLNFRQPNAGVPWEFEKDGETVMVPADGRLRASSGDVLRQAALDGLGVFYGPDYLICEDAMAGRLVRLLPDWKCPGVAISCVWPGGGRLRGKAKLLADHVGDALKFAPKPD